MRTEVGRPECFQTRAGCEIPHPNFPSQISKYRNLALACGLLFAGTVLCVGQTHDTWRTLESFAHGVDREIVVQAQRHEVRVINAKIVEGYFRYALTLLWQPPRGTTVEAMREKYGVLRRVLVLLSDGNVYQFDVSYDTPTVVTLLGRAPGTEQWQQIVGDAIYVVTSSGNVYVTRNDGGSFQIDTVGLNGAFVNHIALDSTQFVYAGTKKGLFKQHPDSSIWHRIDSLYALSFEQIIYPEILRVHVDRRNIIFANSPFRGTFVSGIDERYWSLKTNGIGTSPVSDFSDDARGNVFAITSGSEGRIYRTADTGRTWIRIDTSLFGLRFDPRNSFPFMNLDGDSTIRLATSYGVLFSSDEGNSWSEQLDGSPFAHHYAYVRLRSRTVISTESGLYYREPTDTGWTKSFPSNGFLGGLLPQRDGSGTLYTTGEAPNLSTVSMFYKSTDQGTTWSLDTSGYKKLVAGGIFYVDESGYQHYAVQTDLGFRKFSKPSGGTWDLDTAGIRSVSSQDKANAILSDRIGSVYLAGKISGGTMWKRPMSGGTWSRDTAGLGTRVPEFLTVDKQGNPLAIVAVEYPKHAIFKRTAGVWTRLAHPVYGPSASRISVDSSNAVWASLYNDPNNLLGVQEIRNRGVHVTTDNGVSWSKVGIDSTVLLGLVSYGDTTYALTQGRGLYALTTAGVLSHIDEELKAGSLRFELLQNYPNPFNPQTSIQYSLPSSGDVRLEIFNILGQRIAILNDGYQSAGTHVVRFDAGKFAGGIYFYRLTAGPVTLIRKLVLLK